MENQSSFKKYELTIVARTDMADTVIKTITDLVQSAGFYAGKIEDGGEKRLTFPIEEHERGHYIFTTIVTDDREAPSMLVNLLDDRQSVLRYLLITVKN